MKGTALKHDQGKARLEMLPPVLLLNWLSNTAHIDQYNVSPEYTIHALARWYEGSDGSLDFALAGTMTSPDLYGFAGAAEVFHLACTREERRYPKWNWLAGRAWSVSYGSAMRHLLGAIKDEPDEETGFPHIWHAQANLLMLLHYTKTYKEGDDRPPRELL